MVARARSPYELTSGSSLDDLHPVVRRYVGGIRPGFRGYGSGVFEQIGTPRRWLWPLLRMLGPQGILFPAWEHNVPFSVINAPLVDRDGRTGVVAVRRFHFLTGAQTMVDVITAENPGPDGLVDHLGVDRRFRVRLSTRVVRGELHLVSTAVELRVGRHFVPLPRAVTPRVTVVERFDDAANAGEGAQRVTAVVEAPLVGRVYEYTGTFGYEVRAEPVRAEPSLSGTEPSERTESAAPAPSTRPGRPE
ncbi:DUF4166 domain-containing protein [Herbiconiux sp. CPCC 205716]|uniref:DUF4166 domain-containing protein n=1 Tax=Herbiconiux gentiana TaxID=2970912 RepID=A0ABT2GA16_9MICO|nr:DUF4166 domain-containing protein [Herbiconiux gentiana]MCS5713047.1 DUF4166 domain-containing protein [Herbiconiux gentiana]